MLRLEHELLLRHVEQRGRPEGGAEGEQRQHRLLGLPVLALQHPDTAADVQPLPDEEKHVSRVLRIERNSSFPSSIQIK